MKVYRELRFQWDGHKYIKIYEDAFMYEGEVELACGASSGQKAIGQQQSNFYNQVTTQAGSVFGNSSTVFQDLLNTFAPTVAAGPNQQGFSPTELSNLNSQAITQTGQAYRNAKAAVGDAESAQNGGNASLPGGGNLGVNAQLAESAANQTAGELSNITQQNYAVGRQNYDVAVQGLANAPSVFNTASGFDNAATGAGSAAANTQNQISQQNNSWISAVTGALGQVGGAAAGALLGGNSDSGSGDQNQSPNNGDAYNPTPASGLSWNGGGTDGTSSSAPFGTQW